MISLRHVSRHYSEGERVVHAVEDVSLEIGEGEFVAVTGPSGCGKSTLMHLIGGMDTPTTGEIMVDGVPLHRADDRALTEYRRRRLGVVFQFFNLLPTMTVEENVAFPLLLQGEAAGQSQERAAALLARVGLTGRSGHFPHQLSGGEQQRVAIARALVHQPRVLLADEPTGNLDSEATGTVMELLRGIAADRSTTLLVVTHSLEVASAAERQVTMRDGRVVRDEAGKASVPAARA